MDFFNDEIATPSTQNKENSDRLPKEKIIPQLIDLDSFKEIGINDYKIAWLGHSAFILNINGKIILLDPMLGSHAAPIPLPSLERYSKGLPFDLKLLEKIDMVVLSHDHYDHLDYPTIKRIRDKVSTFIVPIGIGNHLRSWKVNDENIVELNWDEKIIIDDVELTCLPSRHFSGRGPFNRRTTLWASWAIKSSAIKIYFSGDSGYGKHFKEIGEEHGPFDLSLLDSGQYNIAWKHSHMFPFQSVQAAQDLKSKFFMPIHWAGFTLSMHPWDEPIKKSIEYATKVGVKYIAPEIGQILSSNSLDREFLSWWERY